MNTPEPARAYLDPLHNELDRLRTENERLTGSLDVALRHVTSDNHPEDALRFARLHIESALAGQSRPFALTRARIDRLSAENANLFREVETAEARLEQAEARVDQLTDELALTRDTLRLRSDAVNTVGATNDKLRAALARIDSTLRLIAPEHITPHGARLIRAALVSQEPNA